MALRVEWLRHCISELEIRRAVSELDHVGFDELREGMNSDVDVSSAASEAFALSDGDDGRHVVLVDDARDRLRESEGT